MAGLDVAVVVWVLWFASPDSGYWLEIGEYADKSSCQKAGKLYTESIREEIPELHRRPIHFGCWPVRKLWQE